MGKTSYPSPITEAESYDFSAKCPYRNADSVYCAASAMRAAISRRQNAVYCFTENYDCCPVFLGKVLRETRVNLLP